MIRNEEIGQETRVEPLAGDASASPAPFALLGAQSALVEADRCLYCFDAPCAGACPTHIDVPRFIRKIASGNLMGAAQTIVDANVLGLSCARVCPVDVLCEGACVMHGRNEEPIAIGRLQAHAMDHFYVSGGQLPVGAPVPIRVACVGAGPASLACAAELRAHGVSVTIFEKRELPGGLNTYGVAPYKLTPHESVRETNLIRRAGVSFRTGVEVGRDLSLAFLEREFDAIFLAPGLGRAKRLDIPGELLSGVIPALEFIAGAKGDAELRAPERVVVIGGGNTAIDAAIAARCTGSRDVALLYRRGERDLPAFAFEAELAHRAGVRFFWRARPICIEGAQHASAVLCDDGRRFECDAVIVAIGQTSSDWLARIPGVRVRGGLVEADPDTGQTGNPRYFAGGDCVNGGREVVDAAAAGKRAARGMLEWLT